MYLSCQTSLVPSLIDYEQAFNSVDKKALAKVLSLYGKSDKYIKVISAKYEKNTDAGPFIRIILMDFVLKSTRKAMWDHGIKWGGHTLLNLDYADDLSILDESVSKMNDI